MKWNPATLRKAEWAAAILLTVIVLGLMVARVRHAGALWRDECGAVQVARLPTFGDVLREFQHEAFPPPFYALLRLYTNLFGTTDGVLRFFGFASGLALMAALWINARCLGRSPPLLALALLGLNTSVLCWTTTVRGYGLGCAMILLTFGLTARVLVTPTRRWVIAAFLAGLVSVQCVLTNSVLLAVIGGAAVWVFLLRKKTKAAALVLGLGGLCAVSMLLYLGSYASGREWDMLLKFPLTVSGLLEKMISAIEPSGPLVSLAWHDLFLALVGGGIWWLVRTKREKPAQEWDWLLFGVVAAVGSLVGYYIFLKVLSYEPQPWHFLGLICLLAAALDLIAESWSRFPWVRVARLIVVAIALVVLPFVVWAKITLRQTNTDLVARTLEQNAKPNDLIVLTPWVYGVSFHWYYRGVTPWVTLPNISDHRMHRYELVKEKMVSPNPIDDVREMVDKTLQAGGRVWLVGDHYPPRSGEVLAPLPPAPGSLAGWNESVYELNWSQLILFHIQKHSRKWGNVKLQTSPRISEFESLAILMAEGWQ